jgi:predicted nucleotidyltransferase
MTMAELRQHREEILDIARNRGISDVQVFGSVARGDARPDR